MTKLLCVAIALLCIQCLPAAAVDQNCMASYYRTKPPGCIDIMLSRYRQLGAKADPNTVIGFLAHIFSTSPEEKRRILQGEPSQQIQSVDLVALYRAGLYDDARKFADENQISAQFQKLAASRLAPFTKVTPSSNPADNDLLIGAYMASGDTTLIGRILDNFATADDSSVSDALRMSLMQSKFGPTMTAKGRENVMAPAGCSKYKCKTDPTKFLRVLTLASAFWALQSLSQQDEGIKKTSAAFFESDPRLKTLVMTEQVAFGNYVAALAMFAAFKPNQVSAEGAQTYEATSKSAMAYEKLEPAQNGFTPIEAVAKSGKPPK